MNHKPVFRLCAFADEADASLDGQICALRDHGIRLIELRGVNGRNVADLTEADAHNVRKRLDSAGIAVWSVGSPIGKTDIAEDPEKEQNRFLHVLSLARILGAQCIRLFSFYGTGGDAKYFPAVVSRLEGFLRAAAGSGIVLCHENEKGIYGEKAAACEELHRALPDLRAVFDPANFVQAGEDVLSAWRMLSPYVYYGHIKDAKANGDVVVPGEGDGALASYLPLFPTDHPCVLTVEPHLASFVGLAGLEEEGARSAVNKARFRNSREAFDCAISTLRQLIADCGCGLAE